MKFYFNQKWCPFYFNHLALAIWRMSSSIFPSHWITDLRYLEILVTVTIFPFILTAHSILLLVTQYFHLIHLVLILLSIKTFLQNSLSKNRSRIPKNSNYKNFFSIHHHYLTVILLISLKLHFRHLVPVLLSVKTIEFSICPS